MRLVYAQSNIKGSTFDLLKKQIKHLPSIQKSNTNNFINRMAAAATGCAENVRQESIRHFHQRVNVFGRKKGNLRNIFNDIMIASKTLKTWSMDSAYNIVPVYKEKAPNLFKPWESHGWAGFI